MNKYETAKQMQGARHAWNGRLGFVPTMGALHAGHAALIERAKRECDRTVVSIFVNPTQFNDPQDLEKYPQPLARDLALLEQLVQDAEVRLKKLLELSDQINKLLEERERQPLEKTGSAYET